MKKIFFLFITGMLSLTAQHIFPEKFEGCVTDLFALESDSTTAKMNKADFIQTVCSGIDPKIMDKISGTLSLQIIVDREGRSCLLSIKNETNIPSKKLNLKSIIDSKLVWAIPYQKVSVIAILNFNQGEVYMKRMGLNGNSGWHEIWD